VPRLKVVQILVNVHVQQQRLAAAGGIPEGDLVQVVRFKRAKRLRAKSRRGNAPIPRSGHPASLTLVEIPVEVNLGEQQREVLKVLHLQLMAFQLVALGGDGLPVGMTTFRS
jgi:hypothetical protein